MNLHLSKLEGELKLRFYKVFKSFFIVEQNLSPT